MCTNSVDLLTLFSDTVSESDSAAISIFVGIYMYLYLYPHLSPSSLSANSFSNLHAFQINGVTAPRWYDHFQLDVCMMYSRLFLNMYSYLYLYPLLSSFSLLPNSFKLTVWLPPDDMTISDMQKA